jgi:DNA-binding MarR family transcriptional regulator
MITLATSCHVRLINLLLLVVAELKQLSPDLVRAGADLRVAVGRIARRLRQAHAVGDVTLSEVSVLARLDRDGPNTSGALAELERIRPQAMGVTLSDLEGRGLVRREADAADGRKLLVSITDAGRNMVSQRRSASAERLGRAMAEEFSVAEQRRLLAVLPLLDRLAEKL